MNKIAVVMSTFNGEKYVAQQIDTILRQEGVEVQLFVRDDGAKDHTMEILANCAKSHGNLHIVNKTENENLGVTKSFNAALREALAFDERIEYFAFSDQDDCWLPQKLKTGINAIMRSKNKKGAMYYSNLIFADEQLNQIGREHRPFYDDYLEILWKSPASGCTMVFNRNLLNYWAKYDANIQCLHDGWLYRLAKCIGSDMYFGEDSHILYRQHAHNVVGQEGRIVINASTRNILGAIQRRLKPRQHCYQKDIREIFRVARDDMPDDNVGKTMIVLNYNKSLKYKWRMLNFEGLGRRPLAMRMLWFDKVLFNMI